MTNKKNSSKNLAKIGGFCEPNEFKCRNNKCVLKTWRCDGENDCGDDSDEAQCATLPPNANCRYDEYECRSKQCVPKSFQCDQHTDCMDGSDEIGCRPPVVIAPPPPMVNLTIGSILNITCRATGTPIPLIVWRRNWGHVPEKCSSTSNDGFGILTCRDMEVADSGAYSCEIINTVGTHFVNPDTIVIVIDDDQNIICPSGSFNSDAHIEDECIDCFCFGVSSQCTSANLYNYQILPPSTSLQVVGVTGHWNGHREISINEFSNHDLIATHHGVQLRLSDIPVGPETPYYTLPNEYIRNQLKSYGGFLKYEIMYTDDGVGRPIQAPDVVMIGNELSIEYRSQLQFRSGSRQSVSVHFSPGKWYTSDNRLASRQQIMMVLADVTHLLVKLQYVDTVQREVELLNIVMDSAGMRDLGLGSASLVEQCKCPVGYDGLSCETCAVGFVRQKSGQWLGRCVPDTIECRPGYYLDPNTRSCRPCECPNAGHSFAHSCQIGSRGELQCECQRGYTGVRCEQCEPGYVGQPMLPNGRCELDRPVSICDPRGTSYEDRGRCICKSQAVGTRCDQCAANSFNLNHYAPGGCIDCFCMGVTRSCTSSSQFRDTVTISAGSRSDSIQIITDYSNPENVAEATYSPEYNEYVFNGIRNDNNEAYYWLLPTRFLGDKIGSYGGNLNYTIRYKSIPGGHMSRNTAADVVINSSNDITIVHHTHLDLSSSGTQSYSVPILETSWKRSDDTVINREHLLMALADVQAIYVKASYTTLTEEAGLSAVSLDISTPRNTGSNVRAAEVEQCQCPAGHQGLSCEDCSPGYTRGQEGLYLGLCEPCSCNDHSDDCDADTGVCRVS